MQVTTAGAEGGGVVDLEDLSPRLIDQQAVEVSHGTLVTGSATGIAKAASSMMSLDVDPGPLLIVMPDKKSAEQCINERIRPLLEHTPKLRAHLSERAWDNTLST